jgi:hypothetical protein
MAVIPWRAPGPDDPDLAFLLVQVHKAQETLDRAVSEAQALPETDPSRLSRLQRYTALQREVERAYSEATRLARGWATTNVSRLYAQGHIAAAMQLRTAANFTLAHKDAIAEVVRDAYADVATGLQQVPQQFRLKVAAQRQLERLTDDRRGLIQVAGRELVAQQLLLGELSPADAARRLRDELWKNGVQIIDRSGRFWDAEAYSRMLIRTKSANAFNVGTLNKSRQEGVSRVLVFDGTQDSDCARANGQIWTLDYAYSHVISHPNCRRAFAPQPGRGALHRASLEEIARFGALTFTDELVLATAVRAIRRWNAVGKIELIPPPIRAGLDSYEATAALVGSVEWLETWLTSQFMPLVEKAGEVLAPGIPARMKNAAIAGIERRALPVRQAIDDVLGVRVAHAHVSLVPDESVPLQAFADEVREATRTLRGRDVNTLIDKAFGIDDWVDEFIARYRLGEISLGDLVDEMKKTGDPTLFGIGTAIDNEPIFDALDVIDIATQFFGNRFTTTLGGGVNGSIAVIDNRWILKGINGEVQEIYPVYVNEEWGTFFARLLGLPRPDTELVRVLENGEMGIIAQTYLDGWKPLGYYTANDTRSTGNVLDDLFGDGDIRGLDQARRLQILNLIYDNNDSHEHNWLVQPGRTIEEMNDIPRGRRSLSGVSAMPIDLERTFGSWTLRGGRQGAPAMSFVEDARFEAIQRELFELANLDRRRSLIGGPEFELILGPNLSPAEYIEIATVELTDDEILFIYKLLEGGYDDDLRRIAWRPSRDAENFERIMDHLGGPEEFEQLLEFQIERIKDRIRRALAVGYLDDGTRSLTFTPPPHPRTGAHFPVEISVGDVVEIELRAPYSNPLQVRNYVGRRNIANLENLPQIDEFIQGEVWHMWRDPRGTKWVAIAHMINNPDDDVRRGFVVIREEDMVSLDLVE